MFRKQIKYLTVLDYSLAYIYDMTYRAVERGGGGLDGEVPIEGL